jgi:hypothetical protein
MSHDRNDARKVAAVLGSLAVSLGISNPASAGEANLVEGSGSRGALESEQIKQPVSQQGKGPVSMQGKGPVSSQGKGPVSLQGKGPVSEQGKLESQQLKIQANQWKQGGGPTPQR